MKIALIQMYSDPEDPAANFSKAVSYIRSAASQGAQLAILPEYHISSWDESSPTFLSEQTVAKAAVYLAEYRVLAKELGICIVPGTLLEREASTPAGEDGNDSSDARDASGIANVCYFIDDQGQILQRYQKKNLWHPERPHLSADTETPHTAFSAPASLLHSTSASPGGDGHGGDFKIGLLICWDLAFPEAFRELVSQGAKLVVVVSYWYAADAGSGLEYNRESETVFLENVCVARAFENTCAVAFVNTSAPVGRESMADPAGAPPGQTREFTGVSQLALPFVGSRGKCGKGEEMKIVELDVDLLEVAESAYKVRMDMRNEEWHYKHTLQR